MRCTKTREVIVLEASGDATEVQRRRAAAHVGDCDECRRFAAEEPVSLASLRTSPPLRDADFAAIRARVLSRVARAEEPRGLILPLRFAVALTIVGLLGLGVLLSIRRSDDPKRIDPPVIAANAPKPASTPKLPAVATPVVEVPRTMTARVTRPIATDQSETRSRRAELVAPVPGGSARRSRALPSPTTARQTTNPEMRIQIQTPDPDVRIIWIVNPTPPQFTFPKEES